MPRFDDALRGYAYPIHKRDGFRCRYCGLDGTQTFASWLSLSWDHLLPKGDPRRDDPKSSVDPVVPAGFEWRQALGDYRRLPEWIGYFTQAIDDDGWPTVVAAWVPRLMPALRTALFHGAIRAAHAVRAVDAADTPPRRGELARALGYWAARYREGQPAGLLPYAGDLRIAVVRAAA